MKVFRGNLKRAIAQSTRYRNDVWSLASDAGLGRKTVYNILRDEKLDYSKTGPGIFGMARLAKLLEVSTDSLVSEIASQSSVSLSEAGVGRLSDHVAESFRVQEDVAGQTLSVDLLLRLHSKSGGRIEAFAGWLDRCDQYFPPAIGDVGIRVKSVGACSLSAISMGVSDEYLLQDALDTVEDVELRQRWLADYGEACKRGTLTTVESLDVQMPNLPVRVKMEFIRCLLFVQNAASDRAVLNFSLLIV